MAVKKNDISQADSPFIKRDDSEVDRSIPKFLYSKAQHVNRSTYSDLPVAEVRNVEKQTLDLFSYQIELDYEYQTDEEVEMEISVDNKQEQLFYPEVKSGELGQKINSDERKKIKANLKKVEKVKQSKVDFDVVNFVDL